jgi:hypothetical protein
MPLEEVRYLNSYLKNNKVLSGSFPITINGYISCNYKTEMTKEERDHILSETPDAKYFSQLQYINTMDDAFMKSLDGNFLVYF